MVHRKLVCALNVFCNELQQDQTNDALVVSDQIAAHLFCGLVASITPLNIYLSNIY